MLETCRRAATGGPVASLAMASDEQADEVRAAATTGDPGDAASDRTRPARLDAVEADLAAVEHALARLDAGTYGTCEVCGTPLPPARLEADPTLARCDDHLAPSPEHAS